MTIYLHTGEMLFNLFPELKGIDATDELIIERIRQYYTVGHRVPEVTFKDGLVVVDFGEWPDEEDEFEFDKAIRLCDKGKYREAKPILHRLIQRNPIESEYHRMLGQILSDEGHPDEAIDSLMEALRWNPDNVAALIMTGNIYSNERRDYDTARIYYESALRVNPEDHLALNNLATNYLLTGDWEKGADFLEKARFANPGFPKTYYGLALVKSHSGDDPEAFDFAQEAVRLCGANDEALKNEAIKLMEQAAMQLIGKGAGISMVKEFCKSLEARGKVQIRLQEDDAIPTAARLELAENYRREYHLVRYKKAYPAVEHLIMHELCHLLLIYDARDAGSNMLFVSSQEERDRFFRDTQKEASRLAHNGLGKDAINGFLNSIFDGINSQIYNAPLDLFIEDLLHTTYPGLRPYQFVSLSRLLQEGINAVTKKEILAMVPDRIAHASRVLNMVQALWYRNVYGVDVMMAFQPKRGESESASGLFEEFAEYRHDKNPGEEYELVAHWGKDLKLDGYFHLVDESQYRSPEELIRSIEDDPLELYQDQSRKDAEREKFRAGEQESGLNMAVVMYMLDALKYFDPLSGEKIRDTAMEIAMLGTQGIKTDSASRYKLANVPGKSFSGYHLLAYYYVSWALAIPEMLDQLELPYSGEYDAAKNLFEGGTK